MAKYPGTLESNNPKEFGIVYATEVAGHKTVQSLEELNTLPDAILSKSKTNLNNDAIGQIWFVIDQNKYYQLVSWEPKTWEEFEAGVTNEQFTNTLNSLKTEITNNLNTKVDKEDGKGLSSNDYIDEEKSKLEGIEAGAQVNKVNSVAGKIGDVVLNKTDVGLSNVDNTADLDKPISTATQAALDTKADIDDLSNVLSEEVIGEPLLEEINTLTREELKKDLFIDMWNKAVGSYGTYNAETDYFELNGLTDITYEEAIEIYTYSITNLSTSSDRKYCFLRKNDIRTVLPFREHDIQKSWRQSFYLCSNIEQISCIEGTMNIADGGQTFAACYKLKKVLPDIILENCSYSSQMFLGCVKLETLKINYINCNIDISDSPLWSLDSISYTVNNRLSYTISTKAITITVHPDVYTKLTDESNTEWNQVLVDAVAKNISFATV